MKASFVRLIVLAAMLSTSSLIAPVPDANAHTNSVVDSVTYLSGARCWVGAERAINGWSGADWVSTWNHSSCDSVRAMSVAHPTGNVQNGSWNSSYSVRGWFGSENNYDTFHFAYKNGIYDSCTLGTRFCR